MFRRDKRLTSLHVSREYLVHVLDICPHCRCCFIGEFFSNLCACCSTKKISGQALQRVYLESCNCRLPHGHIFDRQVWYFMILWLLFVLNEIEVACWQQFWLKTMSGSDSIAIKVCEFSFIRDSSDPWILMNFNTPRIWAKSDPTMIIFNLIFKLVNRKFIRVLTWVRLRVRTKHLNILLTPFSHSKRCNCEPEVPTKKRFQFILY